MRAPLALPIVFTAFLCGGIGDRGAWAADAGGGEGAEALIRHGVDLRRQGKDQEALDEFRKAYAQAKSPRALAQVGLAEQALGRWVSAEADLEQAVANKSDPWIRKNASALNAALEGIRRHLGSLDVIGAADAELRIDGRAVGTLPLAKPMRLPIGNLTIELRKEGFYAGTRPISIIAAQLTRETIELQPVPPPAAISTARDRKNLSQGEAISPGDSAGDHPSPMRDAAVERGAGGADSDTRHVGWHRGLAWTTAAGAVLGAAVGVGALVLRSGDVNDANRLHCNIMGNGLMPDDPANQNRCLDLANGGERWRVAALVSFSAAGALAIASTILFVTSASSASSDRHVAAAGLRCAPTSLGMLAAAASVPTGVACQLRF
jgi:hypothetical protein